MFCTGAPRARPRARFDLRRSTAVSTSASSSGCDDDTFDPGGAGGIGYPEGIGVPPGRDGAGPALGHRTTTTSRSSADGRPDRDRPLRRRSPPAAQTGRLGDIPDAPGVGRTPLAPHRGWSRASPGDRSLRARGRPRRVPRLVYFYYSAHAGRHAGARAPRRRGGWQATFGIGCRVRAGDRPVEPSTRHVRHPARSRRQSASRARPGDVRADRLINCVHSARAR